MKKYICHKCGKLELASGGNSFFLCEKCRPKRTALEIQKRKAASILAYAVYKGEIPKPSKFKCIVCNSKASVYDHREYAKPLDVVPVCRSCNVRLGPAVDSPANKSTKITQGQKMHHEVKPLDRLSINEVCEMAKGAAYRGESLEQSNVFEGIARLAFESAFRVHSLVAKGVTP